MCPFQEIIISQLICIPPESIIIKYRSEIQNPTDLGEIILHKFDRLTQQLPCKI